jgi:dihydropteroate synthase
MSRLGEKSATRIFKFRSQSYDLSARTYIMGILNVTPDSFSDGGVYFDIERAIARGQQMVGEGADFIDIGGESSRPGSEPISFEEELRRVLPVIERLAQTVSIPLSIDTYKSNVAQKALNAGAQIVNDISGMTFDPRMIDVVREFDACVALMHMKGIPRTMQEEPKYDNVVEEVARFLEQRTEAAKKRGIRRIIVDPGIGFGKTTQHNLELFKNLQRISQLGYPVLVGPSRKSFIGTVLNAPVEGRLEGTAAAVTASILRGANIVRVHDVKEMKKVALVADALKNDPPPS